MVVAGGDFNGDGDAELVAAHGSEIKVFDPVVKPGKTPVASYRGSRQREERAAAGHW